MGDINQTDTCKYSHISFRQPWQEPAKTFSTKEVRVFNSINNPLDKRQTLLSGKP